MWEYIACLFTVIAALVLPIAAFIYLACKKDRLAAPYLLGVLTFLVFQLLTRIPLLTLVLPGMGWYASFTVINPTLHILFLGVTAALFEEGGRFLVMKLFMKDRTRWIDGISFGIGHGGLEAVAIVGLGALATLLTPGGPAAAGATAAGMFAAGAERLFTVVLHIGWSVMVLRSVRCRNAWWLLLAVALHTAVDAGLLLLKPYLSTPALEGALAAAAALTLIYIVRTQKTWEVERT